MPRMPPNWALACCPTRIQSHPSSRNGRARAEPTGWTGSPGSVRSTSRSTRGARAADRRRAGPGPPSWTPPLSSVPVTGPSVDRHGADPSPVDLAHELRVRELRAGAEEQSDQEPQRDEQTDRDEPRPPPGGRGGAGPVGVRPRRSEGADGSVRSDRVGATASRLLLLLAYVNLHTLAGALRAARDDDLQDAIVVGRLQVLGVHV